MGDIYALTAEQHGQLGAMLQAGQRIDRPPAPALPRGDVLTQFARVMTLDYPRYSPITPRQCALFDFAPDGLTWTVKFYGETLHNRVRLKFGAGEVLVDCRATTDQLRAAMAQQLEFDGNNPQEKLASLRKLVRVTVFPGLWEFAFVDERLLSDRTLTPPAIDVEPFLMDGGVVITQEGWQSATEDGDDFVKVGVLDGVPFIRGEVRAGSLAVAHAYGADQFLATHWSCPAFTFKSFS